VNGVVQFVVQASVGAGLVIYAVVLLVQRARQSGIFSGRRTERAPVDDLRLVIDLAARLRDAGKNEAVVVCQKLLDELLKPGVPQS